MRKPYVTNQQAVTIENGNKSAHFSNPGIKSWQWRGDSILLCVNLLFKQNEIKQNKTKHLTI